MYLVRNVALEHEYAMLRRRASKMVMEPIVGGKTVKLRSSITLTDAQVKHDQKNIDLQVGHGVIVLMKVPELPKELKKSFMEQVLPPVLMVKEEPVSVKVEAEAGSDVSTEEPRAGTSTPSTPVAPKTTKPMPPPPQQSRAPKKQ